MSKTMYFIRTIGTKASGFEGEPIVFAPTSMALAQTLAGGLIHERTAFSVYPAEVPNWPMFNLFMTAGRRGDEQTGDMSIMEEGVCKPHFLSQLFRFWQGNEGFGSFAELARLPEDASEPPLDGKKANDDLRWFVREGDAYVRELGAEASVHPLMFLYLTFIDSGFAAS